MTIDDLDLKSDESLDELFAVEVAQLVKCDKKWGPSSHPLMGVTKTDCGHANCHPIQFWPPKFTTDANAVLPWLEKWKFNRASRWVEGKWLVSISDDLNDHAHKIAGYAPTFARAAVIALLRAKRSAK